MKHTAESILARCIEDGDCLLWQGAVSSDTPPSPVLHARTANGGRVNVRARRVLFGLLGLKRPANKPLTIASCWHPLCLAPDHLQAVDKGEAMRGAAQAGRLKNPARDAIQRRLKRSGPQAKLDMARAREIRARYFAGSVSMPKLAAEYGVNTSTIHKVIHNKAWAELAANCSVFNMARSA